MRDIAPAPRRLFGEPIERGGVTIIPVDTPASRTNGAEPVIRPVGAYVVRGERVRWVPAVDGRMVVAALWALASRLVPVAWALVARSAARSRQQDSEEPTPPTHAEAELPAWVSGHATFAGAWAGVMERYFNGNATFTVSTEDPTSPVKNKTFISFDQAAQENA